MSTTPAPTTDLLATSDPETRSSGGGPHLLLSSRPWLMVVAQFYPIIALAITYPSIVDRLSAGSFGGAGLAVLIVSCAVITPTLAQAVAAPVYLHLLGERGTDPRHVARTVLRSTLPAVAVVSPLIAVASLAVGAARHLPLGAFAAFAGLLVLHVLMGALMVPAYALRAAVLLVLPWTAYVLGLLAAPTWIWLPPTAAILVQVVTLAGIGLRRSARVHPPVHVRLTASGAAALRGAAEGLPLWSIPVVVWLLDVDLQSIGFLYVALLPGVLAHQLFFVRVVDPAWRRLEEARTALAERPYPVARQRFDRLTKGIAAGIGQATVLLVVLSLVLITAAVVMHWAEGVLLIVIVVAAFAAVVAMMQSYTVGMFGASAPLAVLGALSLFVVTTGVALRLPDLLVLSTAAAGYLVFALVAVGVSRRVMDRPEYALFWRRAVSA